MQTKKGIKPLKNGLNPKDLADYLLSTVDVSDRNYSYIHDIEDAWDTYTSSWEKFLNRYTIAQIEELYYTFEKYLDKKYKEVFEAWLEDIDKVFYSNSELLKTKLNFGFNGNDVFEKKEKKRMLKRARLPEETEYEDYVNVDNLHFGYNTPYGFIEHAFRKNIEIVQGNGRTIIFGHTGKEWACVWTDVLKGEGILGGMEIDSKKAVVKDFFNSVKRYNGILEKKGKKSAKKSLKEGAGAGYEVEIEGIELDLGKLTVTSRKNNDVEVRIPIKKGYADYWKAEGYYESVDSEGIYYDGIMVQEYDKEDRKIEGGTAYVFVDLNYLLDYTRISDAESIEGITDEEISEFIKGEVSRYIDISCMFGGGWSHSNLDTKQFTLENTNMNDLRKDIESWVLLYKMDISMPYMAEDVNWYFENSYKFDEIFGEEFEESKKSRKNSRKPIKESKTSVLLDTVCDEVYVNGESDVDGMLTLSDFETADKQFYIPYSSFESFPNRRPSANTWNVKAKMKINNGWMNIIIACSLPSDRELNGIAWDDITSEMCYVQAVFSD